jgi:hypothetical protein
MIAVLHEWHEFYLMLGGAAAALVALLFVAISIGVGYLTENNAAATRTFTSPVVIHFTSILFISALALAPLQQVMLFAVPAGVTGLVGLAVAGVTTLKVFTDGGPMVLPFDRFAYGLIPGLAYAAIAAAAALFTDGWEWSPHLLAAAILLLLLINIRNAWDLVLTLVRRQSKREKRQRR